VAAAHPETNLPPLPMPLNHPIKSAGSSVVALKALKKAFPSCTAPFTLVLYFRLHQESREGLAL
jgi:hypothetical protein